MQPDANKAPDAGATRRAIALLLHAAAPEKRNLILGTVWLIACALLEATGPLLGKYFIDQYLLPRKLVVSDMALLLAALLLTGALASVIRYAQLARMAGVAMRSVKRVREEVYGHVLRLPMAFFDKAITGQLVSRVTNDTEQVKNLYVQVLFVILDSSIVVFGALAAMAWLDWRLMLIVLTLIPAVVVIVWFYQRWSAPAVARARQKRSDINAQMSESIAGMAVLQASNAQQRFKDRFDHTNGQHLGARLAEMRVNAWLLRPMLDLINVLLLVVVIHSFGQRALSALEIGILYAFVSYIGRVVDPLIQITLQFGQLQQAVVAAARVDTLLQEQRPKPMIGPQRIGSGTIKIENLGFGYDPQTPVLHDLSLNIPAGGFYGLVGHTGSGKSTLLSLLLRFYQAQTGRITVDGVELSTFSDAHFREDVGLVPQDPFLLASSVRDNIAMGRELDQAAIEEAARAAHCHDFIVQLEQGYDTLLGEGGARLSVGQKQLIAIARALAGETRILFLDEATAHIDSETEQIVQVALSELRGKVTVVAIAHRLSTIRAADCIVVLNHGRIHEQGTHDELMALEKGVYQRLYLLQQMGE
ncbi:ABC transporter ATP-binding protein [Candidatus Aalborgicola defluviihabitans]|jgi:ATP-binding cassette subfamily B protein/ATP-binding cassette subfamily C protein/ATP-binding cassette subfamily B multidrug efflux pump|uniref:ABC transporter ATP-binding protein n=1 Tax=Candidatus Aalborgicola defluviihabitans TaxID=3386187 RepID=UPI001D5F3566|nr:ATP-binding cassette domain-containing protein [Burkholderiales bacterium]MBL0245315.1 ATP-binding cassette domain-containing protein [Rhodoferax sp.]